MFTPLLARDIVIKTNKGVGYESNYPRRDSLGTYSGRFGRVLLGPQSGHRPGSYLHSSLCRSGKDGGGFRYFSQNRKSWLEGLHCRNILGSNDCGLCSAKVLRARRFSLRFGHLSASIAALTALTAPTPCRGLKLFNRQLGFWKVK